MLPSWLKLDLMNCSLTKMHSDNHQIVSYSNFSSIQYLNLSHNGLYGSDMNAFKNMSTSIEFLDLSNNILSSVPFWLGNCAKLGSLYL